MSLNQHNYQNLKVSCQLSHPIILSRQEENPISVAEERDYTLKNQETKRKGLNHLVKWENNVFLVFISVAEEKWSKNFHACNLFALCMALL